MNKNLYDLLSTKKVYALLAFAAGLTTQKNRCHAFNHLTDKSNTDHVHLDNNLIVMILSEVCRLHYKVLRQVKRANNLMHGSCFETHLIPKIMFK